jgi:hypothetical protein
VSGQLFVEQHFAAFAQGTPSATTTKTPTCLENAEVSITGSCMLLEKALRGAVGQSSAWNASYSSISAGALCGRGSFQGAGSGPRVVQAAMEGHKCHGCHPAMRPGMSPSQAPQMAVVYHKIAALFS